MLKKRHWILVHILANETANHGGLTGSGVVSWLSRPIKMFLTPRRVGTEEVRADGGKSHTPVLC